MTKADIISRLQKTLANGTGTLDDLSNLIARVQVDIEAAKKEEAEARKRAETKRGEDIAAFATRMLNEEITDEDVILVMNTYFKTKKLPQVWDKDILKKIVDGAKDAVNDTTKKMSSAVESLTKLLKDIGIDLDSQDVKVTKKSGSADDVINKFLKDMGLA